MNYFLTGNKDADRNILMNVDDDRALISICLTKYGKQLCDDNFFRNYMFKYFPKVYEIKSKEGKWRKVYYENVMIIGKLEELFGLTFDKSLNEYPLKVFNHLFGQLKRNQKAIGNSNMTDAELENILKGIKDKKSIWSNIYHYMFNAAFSKVKNAFRYFADLGGSVEMWKRVILFLISDKDSKEKSFDMLKFVLKEGKDKYQINWDTLIEDAQTKGREDILEYLISEKMRLEKQ